MLNTRQNTPFCAFAPHKVSLMGLQRLLCDMHRISYQKPCALLHCLNSHLGIHRLRCISMSRYSTSKIQVANHIWNLLLCSVLYASRKQVLNDPC